MLVRGECTVRVIEADTTSSQPFMVTEYAAGPSLSEYIDANGPLGADMLYGLATGLAAALTAIHAAGVVHRDLKQTLNRVVASGGTIVAMGSQASDGLVRQQFFVSTDGGKTWRLASRHAVGGVQVPLGHQATLLAGGPGGWLAIGPQAIWTSPDGTSWTLASTHGISPQLPGDSVWVITKTAGGFLAAGKGSAAGGGTQAVIWTSRNGLTWQRMTAPSLGLAEAGEAVQSISYATYRGDDTLMAGTVGAGGATYSGAWLSTDGGSAWTRVSIPVSNGAGDTISGLAFDNAGLIAVRPSGGTSPGTAFGVAYFSPNGLTWRYAGTINAAPGWSHGVVKGTRRRLRRGWPDRGRALRGLHQHRHRRHLAADRIARFGRRGVDAHRDARPRRHRGRGRRHPRQHGQPAAGVPRGDHDGQRAPGLRPG